MEQGYNVLERASRTSPAIWAEYGGHSSSCYVQTLEVALSHVQSMFTSTSFFCLTIYDAAFDYHVSINNNDVIKHRNVRRGGARWALEEIQIGKLGAHQLHQQVSGFVGLHSFVWLKSDHAPSVRFKWGTVTPSFLVSPKSPHYSSQYASWRPARIVQSTLFRLFQ